MLVLLSCFRYLPKKGKGTKIYLTIHVMDNMSEMTSFKAIRSNSDANDEAFFMIRNGFLSLSLLSLCDTYFDFCSFTASVNYTKAQALNKIYYA